MKLPKLNSLSGRKYATKASTFGRVALLGFVLGSVFALIVFAPAVWLSYFIEQNTNGRVQLLNASGTVWQGSAELVLTGGPNSRDKAQLPGHVYWELIPGITQIKANLLADCCMDNAANLLVDLAWKKVSLKIEDNQIRLPAAILSALGAPWNTLGLQAEIVMSHQALQFQFINNQFLMQGDLNIQISQASSKLSTIKPLGSYMVVLKGGSVPTLQLSTTEGSLILTGTGQLSGNRLRFSGEASASPEREQALGNLLNIIGRRSGSRSIITLG